MYNKIFTKILDSSIWLESNPTRIVWFTFLACMDETGFVQFASVKNLAHRAIVTLEEAEKAVLCLESPDPDSSDPDLEGRRIERVPGGWMVLNAPKYRDIVTKAVAQERTRNRVAKHRQKLKCNADVTVANDLVTQSEAVSEATTVRTLVASLPAAGALEEKTPRAKSSIEVNLEFDAFWASYPRKVAKSKALGLWVRLDCSLKADEILKALESQKRSEQWTKDSGQFIPHPATWLFQKRWEDVMDAQGVTPAVGGRF